MAEEETEAMADVPDPAAASDEESVDGAAVFHAAEADVAAAQAKEGDEGKEGKEGDEGKEGEEKAEAAGEEEEEGSEEEDAVDEPLDDDVLCGRGASVNANPGNKRFRAICFARKAEFMAGNHAAKRRIATEIVKTTVDKYQSRFLKKKRGDKGPWYEMTTEQAVLKAAQVMRDHKRPDRLAQRQLMAAAGKRRGYRASATPMDDVTIVAPPDEPIIENPVGVNDNDVLCGRGAFVNGHVGNKNLRKLAMERKEQFDKGSYGEKRALATEIVSHIRGLDPSGRFLRKVDPKKMDPDVQYAIPATESDPAWQEMNDEMAIHKACQVMRDIDRPDRRVRDGRRKIRQMQKEGKVTADEASKSIAELEENSMTAAQKLLQQQQEQKMIEHIVEETLPGGSGGPLVAGPSADEGETSDEQRAEI